MPTLPEVVGNLGEPLENVSDDEDRARADEERGAEDRTDEAHGRAYVDSNMSAPEQSIPSHTENGGGEMEVCSPFTSDLASVAEAPDFPRS